MLSAATDPDFNQFPYLYVYYIARVGPAQQITGRLSRFPAVDPAGNLWVADVGRWQEEEVSIATAGANLGWPVFEGNLCRATAADCAALSPATMPAATYPHEQSNCAIIGGVANPQPNLPYIFGDYCSRRIWALERDPAAATGWRRREIAQSDSNILGFGAGAAGEVFVLMQKNPIRRLVW